MASLRVKNRALTLATRGLLAGSALALATHGLLQVAEPPVIEVPVIVAPAASGGAPLHYYAAPRHWKRLSEGRFLLDADSLARLEKQQPLDLQLKPAGLYAVINSEGTIHVMGKAEWKFWDQGQDDDDLAVALALFYFSSRRNA